ncbi:hypothetical protein SmJEL517_g00307 [Synchytrium microbalum]|uniref:Uncharacterized protein n=1 Tax=Synchytrium microbalum TaxID=1806994 RepID=A0A507CK92_9FUNG|nr:uncharacterized protein SmJEL517_g00307 [Synchytrium microbalum]TPX38315.1 hypothetical protein SmJEL517_g00307 [Synchytrium microbalum]
METATSPTEPPKARYAKALYDFVSNQNEELSLEEEDVVTLSVGVHVRGGWMYGECSGQTGWFPATYVKVLSDEEARAEGLISGGEDAVLVSASDSIHRTQQASQALAASLAGTGGQCAVASNVSASSTPTTTNPSTPTIPKQQLPSQSPETVVRTSSFNLNNSPESGSSSSSTGEQVKSWYSRYKKSARGKSNSESSNGPDTLRNMPSAISLQDSSDNLESDGSNSPQQLSSPSTATTQPLSTSSTTISEPKPEWLRVTSMARATSIRKSNTDLSSKPTRVVSSPTSNTTISIVGAPAASKMRWAEWMGGEEVIAKLNLSKSERQRQEVIYEVIQTEKDYVEDLDIVAEIYIKALRKNKLLRPKDLAVIFSNIEMLLPMNQELLKLLEERQAQNHVVDRVGDIFIRVCDYMKMYTMYCSNYPYALVKLQALRHSKAVQKFLDQCQAMPESRHLNLATYLIKPVQRICKYPLLLRELIKSTDPENPDYEICQQALIKVETVVTIVNEGARQAEGVHKMLELQNRFTTKQNIVAPNRTLVRTGMLDMVSASGERKQRNIYLFTDMLMVAKGVGSDGEKLKLVAAVPYDMILVTDLPDETSTSSAITRINLIEIVHIGISKFIMAGTSLQDKQMWIRALKEAIDVYLNGRKNASGMITKGITDRRLLNVLVPIQPPSEEPPSAPTDAPKTPKNGSVMELSGSSNSPRSPGAASLPKLPALPQLRTTDFVNDVACATGVEMSPRNRKSQENVSDDRAGQGELKVTHMNQARRASAELLTISNAGLPSARMPIEFVQKTVSTGNMSINMDLPDETSSVLQPAEKSGVQHSMSTSRIVTAAASFSESDSDASPSRPISYIDTPRASTGRRSVPARTTMGDDSIASGATKQMQAPRKPPPARPEFDSTPSIPANQTSANNNTTNSTTLIGSASSLESNKRISSNPFIVQDSVSRMAKHNRSSTENMVSLRTSNEGFNKQSGGDIAQSNSKSSLKASASKGSLRISGSKSSLHAVASPSTSMEGISQVAGSMPASVSEQDETRTSTTQPPATRSSTTSRSATATMRGRLIEERTRSVTTPTPIPLQRSQTISPAVREWQSQIATQITRNGSGTSGPTPAPRPVSSNTTVLPRGVAGYVAALESQYADKMTAVLSEVKNVNRSGLGLNHTNNSMNNNSGSNNSNNSINRVSVTSRTAATGADKLARGAGTKSSVSKPVKSVAIMDIIQMSVGGKSKKEYIYVLQVNRGVGPADTTTDTIHHTFEDFFDFHLHLLGHFPEEAGVVAGSDGTSKFKIIPDLPCQKIFVSLDTAKQRVPQLQTYMEAIIALPPKVSRSPLVLNFFKGDGKVSSSLM